VIALRGNVASCSRFFQQVLRHEHVTHGDAAIEVAEEGGLGMLGQWHFTAPFR
jgi:hypothetical protein